MGIGIQEVTLCTWDYSLHQVRQCHPVTAVQTTISATHALTEVRQLDLCTVDESLPWELTSDKARLQTGVQVLNSACVRTVTRFAGVLWRCWTPHLHYKADKRHDKCAAQMRSMQAEQFHQMEQCQHVEQVVYHAKAISWHSIRPTAQYSAVSVYMHTARRMHATGRVASSS